MNFYKAENGVTVLCPDAADDDKGVVDGKTYTKRSVDAIKTLISDKNSADLETTCTSGVTDMSSLFERSDFNGDISTWDTSSVTDMSYMFTDAENFNGDISNWDTSKVEKMEFMFASYTTSKFNGAIGNWDTSNVKSTEGMFSGASAFNKDISGWNVESVTNMGTMFVDATVFNQDIGQWTTASVTNMEEMFRGADAFDQDISGWNVESVTNMNRMFNGAIAFNQDISGWNVKDLATCTDFAAGATTWLGNNGGSIATNPPLPDKMINLGCVGSPTGFYKSTDGGTCASVCTDKGLVCSMGATFYGTNSPVKIQSVANDLGYTDKPFEELTITAREVPGYNSGQGKIYYFSDVRYFDSSACDASLGDFTRFCSCEAQKPPPPPYDISNFVFGKSGESCTKTCTDQGGKYCDMKPVINETDTLNKAQTIVEAVDPTFAGNYNRMSGAGPEYPGYTVINTVKTFLYIDNPEYSVNSVCEAATGGVSRLCYCYN